MKKICFITGSRADYGIMSNLIKCSFQDKSIQTHLVVTGQHLSAKYGNTYKEIIKDKIKIDKKITTLVSSGDILSTLKSVSKGIKKISPELKKLKPDIVVLLGDRFEIFAAAFSSNILGIPIAHIHGGEITEGAFDDTLRNLITKLSHLHFTSTTTYKKRIIQMGEHKRNVFNVGSLSLDNISRLKLYTRSEINKFFFKDISNEYLIICYHPVTLEPGTSKIVIKNLLSALNRLENKIFIFTAANSDPEGDMINTILKRYTNKNKKKSIFVDSMGYKLFLSMLKFSAFIIGNSSSAIIEAPYFKTPTINIGSRQKGRQQANSIINCGNSYEEIQKAIKKIQSKNFKKKLKIIKNPYQLKNSNSKILNILKNRSLKNITKKTFQDI